MLVPANEQQQPSDITDGVERQTKSGTPSEGRTTAITRTGTYTASQSKINNPPPPRRATVAKRLTAENGSQTERTKTNTQPESSPSNPVDSAFHGLSFPTPLVQTHLSNQLRYI